ncbi:MAG: 1-(5-phosphoribosyl)-5-[(5-phosphoribosylamino)methylideneamino]imidazole-4-carboxamide isomerase [Leptolyngbyaceae cyanobacterium SL_7_1]|nr:1-(5-phosphoribosyl)-5-[(5-phosphoribosylamino)methylideneamino]imidazole-4-carboxamide isomerase [Leptolyngbyaceae cyanobacterium SL_7_1]
MDIIPAIDLLEGRCVRLYQGDYQQSQVFDDNPVAVAQRWLDQGATRLHLVDLDGAKAGYPINTSVIEQIVQVAPVPVQVGGGLRDRASVAQLLALGVQQVILGTIAVEQPSLVESLAQEFPDRIIVGIDARNGKVATRGWLENSETEAIELAQRMQQQGVAAVIYTDIYRDGTLQGPNRDALRAMASAISIPLIASGGISSLRDLLGLLTLEPAGVNGAIVGRALYTNEFSLQDAIRAVGQGRWQDVPPDLGHSVV